MKTVSMSSLPEHLREAYHSQDTDRPSKNPQNSEDLNIKSLNEIRSIPSLQERLSELLLRRHHLTEQIAEFGKCYPPTILERAETYEALEYDDLAIFDGYVVYTLCQKELSDEFVTDLEAHSLDGDIWHPQSEDVRRLMVESLALLVRCLTRLGAIDDAGVKRDELREQIAFAGDDSGKGRDSNEEESYLCWQSVLRESEHDVEDVVKKLEISPNSKFGASRREIYPWSTYEPARNTPESVTELNKYLSTIAPDLEAKVTALPAFDSLGDATNGVSHQLGLFAKTNLIPGQEILSEKSILTAIRPLEDALCDACGQDLEGISFEDVRQCDGDDCDVTFCSQDCRDRAVKGYHLPNVEDLEDEDGSETGEEEIANAVDSMTVEDEQEVEQSPVTDDSPAPFCGNQDISLIGRPTNTDTAEWDLYFLLLARSISMSINQNNHPLKLPETKYLWGDFNSSPFTAILDPNNTNNPSLRTNTLHTLPFSLTHTIQYPLDFFTTLSLTYPSATPYTRSWLTKFDPWILQTLFAKFRGVANATQSTFDGRPEMAAVHPGWCLANHSCAPNVRWEPVGVRRFYVRSGEDIVRVDGEEKSEWIGIKAGEEIFSHYTDVRLSVGERRERLREVLGGSCRCKRCLVESGNGM